MEVISSFQVNHIKLLRGFYESRIDGDITTYDIRMKQPNREKVMSTGSCHAIEHIGATYLRNQDIAKDVIYFGPMGCRTGFYMIMRNIDKIKAIEVVKDMMRFVILFEGEIPGAQPDQCGNYSDMDLIAAKSDVQEYLDTLLNATSLNIIYPEIES
ncbi:S-ribosylhomocysteine lyase [Clostridium bowmanii]|uniref:S-ribosylhomocysteine lyase n=1 Tax=Clostridium bowmanii TaxID=132925 RepID=UPI001C0D036D|nr:S-ribosylhomocysteine lyase [Clostridium bowmanii]MBU3192334.1 S-ribosylhomocysteine lyase [Clostridium bowmanii]MCA1076540.1 S-ribosylhomocysteine lyase [Clostridium bowmanii]